MFFLQRFRATSHPQVTAMKEEFHVNVYIHVYFTKYHYLFTSVSHLIWALWDMDLQDGCLLSAAEAQDLWWQNIVQREEESVEVRRREYMIHHRVWGRQGRAWVIPPLLYPAFFCHPPSRLESHTNLVVPPCLVISQLFGFWTGSRE